MRSFNIIEALENRKLLSGVSLHHGLLTAWGDMRSPNTILVQADTDPAKVDVTLNGSVHTYALADIRRVALRGGLRADDIEVQMPLTVPTLILGLAGDDTLVGNAENDKIIGGLGNDSIDAGGGNNILLGQTGNDTLTAGDGNNRILGGRGDDKITVGSGNNLLLGQQGNDVITAGDGTNIIFGGRGDDTITAGNGNDRIHAVLGTDSLVAGNGNDVVWVSHNTQYTLGTGANTVHTVTRDSTDSSGDSLTA